MKTREEIKSLFNDLPLVVQRDLLEELPIRTGATWQGATRSPRRCFREAKKETVYMRHFVFKLV